MRKLSNIFAALILIFLSTSNDVWAKESLISEIDYKDPLMIADSKAGSCSYIERDPQDQQKWKEYFREVWLDKNTYLWTMVGKKMTKLQLVEEKELEEVGRERTFKYKNTVVRITSPTLNKFRVELSQSKRVQAVVLDRECDAL